MDFAWLVTLCSLMGVTWAFFWWHYVPCWPVRWTLCVGPLAVLVNQWLLSSQWALDSNAIMALALLLALVGGTIAVCLLPLPFFLPLLGAYVAGFATLVFPPLFWLLAVAVAVIINALTFFYKASGQLQVFIYSLCVSALATWLGYYAEQTYWDSNYRALQYPLYLPAVAFGLFLTRLFYLAQINRHYHNRYNSLIEEPDESSAGVELAA